MKSPIQHRFIATALIMGLALHALQLSAAQDSSTIPSPRKTEYEWMSIDEWYQQHNSMVEIAKKGGEQKLLFLGDSITAGWYWGKNKQIFNTHFGKYQAVNFGIGGDQTQQVLWRLQNGGIGNLQPELIVLLIGINNIGHSGHSPEQVAAGVKAIVDYLQNQRANSQILLLGVFPAEAKSGHPTRLKIQRINKFLEKLSTTHSVHFADIGEVFLDEQGDIPKSLMADFLHPTHTGYQRFAAALSPIIEKIMQPSDKP